MEDEQVWIVEERNDTWWISNGYLTAAAHMVARQFIDEKTDLVLATRQDFEERVTYVMRQHCPIAYSYFLQHWNQDGALPAGVIDVIIQIIQTERPLFLGGGKGSGIILPS